ncbi:MAG: transposase [Gammaproteobacteria bacterium]|nr:transposase [Gammaproteobacteria bacterium]
MDIQEISFEVVDQEVCVAHLERLRWGNTPVCPYCESTNTYRLKQEYRHHCNTCRKSFSVTVGTILHDTRLPLPKWFRAMRLVVGAENTLSAKQLQRDLQVSYKTAWSIKQRILEAMRREDQAWLHRLLSDSIVRVCN